MKAMEKSIVVSDWAGHKLNTAAEKVSLRLLSNPCACFPTVLLRLTVQSGLCVQIGSEAFFPVTDDFPNEMNKAARILRSFTGAFLLSFYLRYMYDC
jgi:hypothetical protein